MLGWLCVLWFVAHQPGGGVEGGARWSYCLYMLSPNFPQKTITYPQPELAKPVENFIIILGSKHNHVLTCRIFGDGSFWFVESWRCDSV